MNEFGRKPVKILPNLKIWWKDPTNWKKEFDIEIFDKDLRCHMCGKHGAYHLQSEHPKIGLCKSHLNKTGDWKKLEPISMG